MNLHKVKNFKCYQAVRIGQDLSTHYIAGDNMSRTSINNDAFLAVALHSIIIKSKKTGEEIFVPLTNIQNFSLMEEVLKKPSSDKDSADPLTPEERAQVQADALKAHKESGDVLKNDAGEVFSPVPPEELNPKPKEKTPKKKASKKVSKKTVKA